MGTQVGIVPLPHEVRAETWARGDDRGRMRVIRLGDASTLHVPSRAVLEALQAALREIELDFGKAEQAAIKAEQAASDQVPTVMADWPAMAAMAPGELMEIHGK